MEATSIFYLISIGKDAIIRPFDVTLICRRFALQKISSQKDNNQLN